MACFLVAGMMLTFSGCGESSTTTASATKAPPKLDFHKPRNFSLAVERLRIVHDVLLSESEVPQPVTYTVVEVNHAHGDGNPHVHYKLVSKTGPNGEECDCEHDHDTGHDHDHDHDHAHDDHDHEEHGHGHRDPFESTAPRHTIVVDVFTELSDIVRWLPAIAADGDMSADDWKKVKSASETIGTQLESCTGESAAKHSSYKSKADTIGAMISELETLVKPSEAKIL